MAQLQLASSTPGQLHSTSRTNFVCKPCRIASSSTGRCLTTSPLSPHYASDQLPRRQHQAHVFPFDLAWSPNIDAQSLAPQLFAASLFPYLAFLYYLTKSGKAPKLMLVGFYFLLVFVGATIPAGIYAKTQYGTSLANVDWLHGSAESLLTITNLMIVLGLRQGIREAEKQKQEEALKSENKPIEQPTSVASKPQQ